MYKELARFARSLLLRMHKASLTWKDMNIFNNANLCAPKNNDCAASVVALMHAHVLADHVARSIS